MKAIIGKKLASLTILQNKTQCVGFFTQTCKMKHSMDKAIIFKFSISILFQKVFLDWKLSPINNRPGGQEGWTKNVLCEKIEKLIRVDIY